MQVSSIRTEESRTPPPAAATSGSAISHTAAATTSLVGWGKNSLRQAWSKRASTSFPTRAMSA